jgi:hypothetical protein
MTPEPISVEGRPGVALYLNKDWDPVPPSEALFARVLFDDGGSAFFTVNVPVERALGGPGSGNFGHAGRPGEVGGSAASAEDDALLEAYTTTGGTYRRINEDLRAGHDLTNDPTVTAITRAFERHGEIAPSVVYRGIAGYEPEELNIVEGQTFKDPGFVSTSQSRSNATRFALNGSSEISGQAVGIVFKINTRGATALRMGRYSRYGEDELLLPRGMTFKVTSVKEGYPGEKLAVVTMSVVKS